MRWDGWFLATLENTTNIIVIRSSLILWNWDMLKFTNMGKRKLHGIPGLMFLMKKRRKCWKEESKGIALLCLFVNTGNVSMQSYSMMTWPRTAVRFKHTRLRSEILKKHFKCCGFLNRQVLSVSPFSHSTLFYPVVLVKAHELSYKFWQEKVLC